MTATQIVCPLRIGAARTEIGDDAAVRAALLERAAVSISPMWEDGLLERMLRICRDGVFAPETIARVGSRTFEQDDLAGRLIRFLLERRLFLDWVQDLAGCERLQHATGLIGEMAPGSGQGLDWHDDQNDGGFRRLAITIHLSDAAYEGGVFEIREKGSADLLFRQTCPPAGTMTLFRIGQHLHHRVTPVTSGGPRRVFGGWLSV